VVKALRALFRGAEKELAGRQPDYLQAALLPSMIKAIRTRPISELRAIIGQSPRHRGRPVGHQLVKIPMSIFDEKYRVVGIESDRPDGARSPQWRGAHHHQTLNLPLPCRSRSIQ